MSLFAGIREAAARVAERARSVHIDDGRLATAADELIDDLPLPSQSDPAHQHRGDESSTLAFVVTLDAVNFGSGWFPHMSKRPGRSGYFTVAGALTERFDRKGPFSAGELRAATAEHCAEIFEQDLAVPEMVELMGLFARAWNDLGVLLDAEYDGRFESLVEKARGRAERLVELLAAMPFYRDVHSYDEFEVPLYKRAQITVADLATAFEGRGPGRFEDQGSLTIFADNLVPHVLRRLGVLVVEPDLAKRIADGELLSVGSPEEVEIRAVALHAVEQMTKHLAASGRTAVTAQRIDEQLWNRGQRPEMKAHPRHRARSVYY